MELFGHSVEHFNGNSEMDRKLVILHLANAAELLLKDLLLDQGQSIYKNTKETITIHAAVSMLSECSIALPNFNKMELLIDERNALQHRYGSPNELTTVYYMDATSDFFRSMLKEHYDLDLDEVLPQFVDQIQLAAFRSREPTDETELENLKRLARVHPVGAFLSASRYLEQVVDAFFSSIDGAEAIRRRPGWAMLSHRMLSRYGVELPDGVQTELDHLRKKRNLVAHGRGEPTEQDVVAAVDTIEKLERSLEAADRAKVAELIKRDREEFERQTSAQHLLKWEVRGGAPSPEDDSE